MEHTIHRKAKPSTDGICYSCALSIFINGVVHEWFKPSINNSISP